MQLGTLPTVSNLLTLLTGLLGGGPNAGLAAEAGVVYHAATGGAGGAQGAPAKLLGAVLFSLTWSVGGLLQAADRPAFDARLRALTHGVPGEVRWAEGTVVFGARG